MRVLILIIIVLVHLSHKIETGAVHLKLTEEEIKYLAEPYVIRPVLM